MKEATRLLIEANIIPESVVNLCRIWNGDGGEIPQAEAKQRTQAELLETVRKVASLLEADALPEMRETEPDLEAAYKKTSVKGVFTHPTRSGLTAELTCSIGFTALGKMIIRAADLPDWSVDKVVDVGNLVLVPVNRLLRIKHVEPRYANDVVAFYVCDVEEVE